MSIEPPRADRPPDRTRPERFVDRVRRERVELLLEVTTRLLAQKGPGRLRVEDVAEEAGVAKGTVYMAFDSKESLVRATLDRCRRQLLGAIKGRVDEATGAEDRLEALLCALATIAVEEPHLTALLRWALPDGLQEDGPSLYRDIEAYVEQVLVEARKDGALSAEVDPRLGAQAVLALSVLPSLIQIGLDGGPGSVARALRRTLDQLRI